MKVAIADIKIAPGRRPANPEGIDELAQSISKVGLLNPITVDQDHNLVAGLHRLEAAKRLGWTEIECNVRDFDKLQAELAEIDENVVRTSLTVIEFGELLERRKELYESLHPETKATYNGGGFKGNQHKKVVSGKMSPSTKSFAQDTADKLGKSVRTVERTMQMMKRLTPEVRDILRSYPKYNLTQTAAAKLSSLPPDKQKTAAILLATGQVNSIDKYLSGVNAMAAGSATESQKEDVHFLEMAARLKHGDEDSRCTPEIVLETLDMQVKRFCQDLEDYNNEYFREALPGLTRSEFEDLCHHVDAVKAALDGFMKLVTAELYGI